MTRNIISVTLAAALTTGLGLTGMLQTAQGAEEKAAANGYQGEHEMKGKVTKIDQKSGKVSVDTAVGNLDLHFPPPAVADLKQGDEITVRLGYKKAE